MKRLPMRIRIVGFIIIILGIFGIFALPHKTGAISMWVIIAGIIISVIPGAIFDRVYICPKCKARFKKSHSIEFVALARIKDFGEVLTCPECNKTSFCRMELVLPSEDKAE